MGSTVIYDGLAFLGFVATISVMALCASGYTLTHQQHEPVLVPIDCKGAE